MRSVQCGIQLGGHLAGLPCVSGIATLLARHAALTLRLLDCRQHYNIGCILPGPLFGQS